MPQKNTRNTSNKSTKSTSWFYRLPVLPKRVARLLLVALLIGNAGMIYLASTSAATYYVRFIYFCADNSCSSARTATTVDSYGSSVHSWYCNKVGKCFPRYATYKVVGNHSAYYYYTHATNGLSTGTTYDVAHTYYNVYNELVNRGWITSTGKIAVVLGFHSMNHCGVGSGALAITDPQQGCGSIQPSALAHELGHTFLTSSNADHTYNADYNFMHAPLACNGVSIGSCTMYSSQRTTISGRAWFNN